MQLTQASRLEPHRYPGDPFRNGQLFDRRLLGRAAFRHFALLLLHGVAEGREFLLRFVPGTLCPARRGEQSDRRGRCRPKDVASIDF